MYRASIYYIDKQYIDYLYKEDMMAVDKSLLTGSMTMLILKLLSEKDMYGYEMIDTLRKKSQNVFELKAGTLYPLLHGLEEKGMLTVYEQEFLGKTRKYYSITKEGKKLLKSKTEEWNEYSGAIANVLALEV
jgi:DNA-binding PadR family transcriptional regulator